MSQVTPVVAVLEALRTVLADVADLPRRVQIRTALPLLDRLTQYGYPLAALSDELQKAKLDLKPKALSQALVRWREARAEEGTPSGFASAAVAAGSALPQRRSVLPGAPETSGQDGMVPPASSGIEPNQTPKEQLRQIRDMPIDSGKLDRAWRQQQQAKKKDA